MWLIFFGAALMFLLGIHQCRLGMTCDPSIWFFTGACLCFVAFTIRNQDEQIRDLEQRIHRLSKGSEEDLQRIGHEHLRRGGTDERA
jgi:hypothetical protein